MSRYEEIKEKLVEHKEELSQKYKIKKLGMFGSYVRKEQKEKSDLDILVEFRESVDFFEFLELEEYLSKLLRIKVDLVMRKTLKPAIGKHILREVVYV